MPLLMNYSVKMTVVAAVVLTDTEVMTSESADAKRERLFSGFEVGQNVNNNRRKEEKS